MSLPTILAKIKEKMLTVSGVSKVETRLVFKKTAADFFALFTRTDQVRTGWMVTRRSPIEEEILDINEVEIMHHIKLVGFYVLDDSADSEAAFNAIIDGICTVFRGENDLWDTANLAGPCQTPIAGDWRAIHEVLCHYAEIDLVVKEVVAP